MSETNNPYTAPESDVNNNLQSRSAIPKVIGIISIILGTLMLIASLFGIASMLFMGDAMSAMGGITGMSTSYMIISSVIQILTSIWAIFIGFKLLKYLDIGRRHYNYYTVFTIIMSIVSFFYTKSMMADMFKDMDPAMAEAAGSAATMGALAAFIPPIILIIVTLLLNQQNVKDSLTD